MNKEIVSRANEIGKLEEIPRDLWKKICDLGIIGIIAPGKYGGQPGDSTLLGIAAEEVGRGDVSLAATVIPNIYFCMLLQNAPLEAIGNDLIAILNKAKDEADEPLEGLRNMLSGHINLTQKKKSRVKIYVEEQHNLSKRFRKIIYKQHRKIYDLYVDQLKALQRLRIISSEPLSIAAFAIFGMVNWCYRWYREDGGLNIENVAQRLIDLLFYGVLNPAEPSFSASKRS